MISVYMEVNGDKLTAIISNERNEFDRCISDDITMTAEGVDTYHLVKKANRYK